MLWPSKRMYQDVPGESLTDPLHNCPASVLAMDAKRRKVSRECTICREDRGFRAFPGKVTEDCKHVRDVCRKCMHQTIKMEIQLKGQAALIKCPSCSAELSLADVARESSAADAEQLDSFMLQKALAQEPNFVWCAHGCGMGQLVEDLEQNTFMTCQNCGLRTCNYHRALYCLSFYFSFCCKNLFPNTYMISKWEFHGRSRLLWKTSPIPKNSGKRL